MESDYCEAGQAMLWHTIEHKTYSSVCFFAMPLCNLQLQAVKMQESSQTDEQCLLLTTPPTENH